jgi:subtilisin-like proprotein convertase family protein
MASANEAGETDMRRQPIESKTKGTRVLSREGSRRAAAKRSQIRRLTLEDLEARTLMATAPLPIVTGQASLSSNQASNTSNDSSPSVAVDPVNPLKMVMVYTHHDPKNAQIFATPFVAEAEFTVDGGKTWSPLGLPINQFDPSTSNPEVQYTQAFAQGVGIDQNQLLYIGVLENDSANTSGAVITEKFDFSSATPVQINVNGPGAPPDNVVYQWNRSDPNVPNASLEQSFDNFTLVVDSNAASFTDPTTGQVQTDPNAGNVYIAATLDSPPPPNPPSPWNRYTAILGGSTDGINFTDAFGLNFVFVDQQITNGGSPNVGNQHETDPQLSISQGKAGKNDGGELTMIWDDYGSGATASPPVDLIDARGLTFDNTTGDFTLGVVSTVAVTHVRGNLDLLGTAGIYSVPSNVSPLGIGPGAQIAVDNTLGSFSPHQGRLYATFVDRPDFTDPNNPIDNTDIFLVTSDDDGKTWSQPIQVNSDNSVLDGHSGAASVDTLLAGYAAHIQGRPQFQPSIAVDPATGVVGISWLDARDDPATSRVATYMTESLDGGQTFSPQIFANTPQMVTDAITGKQVALGPRGDNQSPTNATTDTTIGFGIHQALIFANGALRAFWASNNDAVNGQLLTIETAAATYPAGPRVIASTMGAVKSTTVDGTTFNGNFSPTDHTPQLDGFSITFDHPVDIASITGAAAADQIHAFFNSPFAITNTPVAIGSVTPLNSTNGVNATTFFVAFATPQTAVGTYSYSIGNYGASATTTGIKDDLRNPGTVQITSDGTNTVFQAPPSQVGQTIPPFNFGVSQTTSTIDITTASPAQLVESLTVTLDITHNFDGDLVIQLTSPSGVTVTLINQEGGAGHNFSSTTLSDTAALAISGGTPPFSGTFRPETPLSVFADEQVDGAWTLNIFDVVNDPNDTGTLNGWSLDIAGETRNFSLGATGNSMDQNTNGTPGQLTDTYFAPAPLNPLSLTAPFNTTTLPLIIPGPSVTGT